MALATAWWQGPSGCDDQNWHAIRPGGEVLGTGNFDGIARCGTGSVEVAEPGPTAVAPVCRAPLAPRYGEEHPIFRSPIQCGV